MGSAKYRIDTGNRRPTGGVRRTQLHLSGEDDVLRDLLRRASHPRSVTAIGTLGHASSFSVISPESEEIVITASDIQHMTQGDQVIFFTEAITYRDIFGKEHLTTLCAYLKLDRERVPFVVKCGLGNDLR
jgi:hypothetical protein